MPTVTMIEDTFDALANFNKRLNRKAVTGTMFAGYADEVPRLTAVVGANGKLKLPSNMLSMGRVSDDGFEITTELKMTEQRGMGSYAVLRRDIQSKDFTIECSFLQTGKRQMAMQNGLDLRNRKMSSDGEFRFAHPENQESVYWSIFIVGRDKFQGLPIFMGKYAPMATPTAKAKEQWQDKTEGLPRPVTMGCDQDDFLHTHMVEYVWGPGALALAAEMDMEVDTVVAA